MIVTRWPGITYMSIPSPESKRVFIFSTTLGKPTRHMYVETRACSTDGPDGGPAWEHIYECEISGARRRFGVEDRKTPGNAMENN